MCVVSTLLLAFSTCFLFLRVDLKSSISLSFILHILDTICNFSFEASALVHTILFHVCILIIPDDDDTKEDFNSCISLSLLNNNSFVVSNSFFISTSDCVSIISVVIESVILYLHLHLSLSILYTRSRS